MNIQLGSQTLIKGNCIIELESFENNYFDLCIADPPYWKVVSQKWDYQWRTEEDYIEWSKKWISKVYDKLRVGGSFYLFGYFRTLALLVPELNKMGFSLRQQIIIDKGMKSVAGRATKNYRIFPNVTESLLFLVKDNISYSRNLLKSRQKELGLTSKEINEALGVKSNGGGMWSIYTGKNICEQFPTEELWGKLETVLKFSYPYKHIAQTFNAQMGVTDVWRDINFYEEERYHPTQKPLKLIERLILTSSNEGDKIVDPFAGSGSTLISADKLHRESINIELNEEYISNIQKRFKNQELILFN